MENGIKRGNIIIRSPIGIALAISLSFHYLSCIGDDIIFDKVDPIIRIMNPIDTLGLGTNYEFSYSYFNETGEEISVEGATWSSDNPSVIDISRDGLATALDFGSALITVQFISPEGLTLMDARLVVVGNSTVSNNAARTGKLRTTSSYVLKGSFSLESKDGKLHLTFADDYEASSNLPGLFVYLTNNPNTTNNAFEIGAVTTFKGEHEYELENVGITDYSHVLYFCKPFVVKVGDGEFDN